MRAIRLYLCIAICILMLLGWTGMARAGDVDKLLNAPRPTQSWWFPEDFRARDLRWRDFTALQMESMRRELQDKPERLWRDDELNAYLERVCWYVYQCLNYARLDQNVWDNNLPDTMERLHRYKWVPVLPLNPFRNWEPVKLVALADGFSAGDVFIEFPPPELWTSATDQGITQAVGIYGRDEQWRSPNPDLASQVAASRYDSWQVVPPGVVMILGAYSESRTSSEYKAAHGHS